MKAKIYSIILLGFLALIFSCGEKNLKTTENSDSLAHKSISLPLKLDIQWKFDEIGEAEFGAPKTQVSIIINGKTILIEKEIDESCNEISKDDFKDREIPEDALSAFSSWWAGSGTVNYIQKSGDKLIVYRTFIAEELSDEKVEWEVLKEILVSDL